MPLTAYGDKNVKLTLKLRDVSLKVRDGAEPKALVHACNYDTLEIKELKLDGFKGDTPVRTWSPDDKAVIENITGDAPADMVKTADEPFFAKPI